jgi:hypothetical protein
MRKGQRSSVIQARFTYEGPLIGEWCDVVDGLHIYPSQEFGSKVASVQFRETDGLQPPAHGSARRSRQKNKAKKRYPIQG